MKLCVWLCLMPLLGMAEGMAASGRGPAMSNPGKPLPGRLFYTPAQREMLVNARMHKVTEIQKSDAPPVSAPMRFDGVIIRSDGVATHWINGRPHVGRPPDNVRNLKPGQTRAAQKVYESYQIRQPDNVRVPSSATPPPPVKPAKPEESAL